MEWRLSPSLRFPSSQRGAGNLPLPFFQSLLTMMVPPLDFRAVDGLGTIALRRRDGRQVDGRLYDLGTSLCIGKPTTVLTPYFPFVRNASSLPFFSFPPPGLQISTTASSFAGQGLPNYFFGRCPFVCFFFLTSVSYVSGFCFFFFFGSFPFSPFKCVGVYFFF